MNNKAAEEQSKILKEIKLIKDSLFVIARSFNSIDDWLPKKAVMRFFDYGDTQLRELEKSKSIVVSKIGNRKFYSLKSIIELIEKHKK